MAFEMDEIWSTDDDITFKKRFETDPNATENLVTLKVLDIGYL